VSEVQDRLRHTGLFNSLDDAAVERLIAGTREVTFDEGRLIVQEGDPGDALYVILEGDVQIFRSRRTGGDVVLARLGAGEHFGEQALVPGRTGLRNASVRAATRVRLCRVDKKTFQDCLNADDPLRESLLRVGDQQLVENLLAESRLFRAFRFGERPDHESDERRFSAGDVIFRQGDEADVIYLVLDGEVGIHQDDKLVASLNPGQCFGELGLLTHARRAATARATTDCRLMVVPAARFEAAMAESEELGALFKTLRRLYKLPKRGRVIQSTGTFSGRDAVTNLYELGDGRKIMASCVFDDHLYNADQVFDGPVPALTTLTFVDEARQLRRELRLSRDRRLVGVTAHGPWPALADLQWRLLEGVRLAPSASTRFEQTGELALEESRAAKAGLLCLCVQVEERAIIKAISSGCTELPRLQEQLGCGTVCGSCIPQIKLLLGNENWAPVRVAAERQLNGEIRQFQLLPVGKPVASALPGQHIIVSGFVGGNWVQRAYTLSSACNEPGYYEITVKREPQGVFSRWLFDEAGDDAMIRISPPQGSYFFRPSGKPVVALVAGIGVTPALAILRSLRREGWQEPLHIDFSVRRPEDAVCVEELRSAAADSQRISLRVRSTATDGRLQQEEVSALGARFPGADYFVCGPTGYMEAVAQMLRTAGVQPSQIHIENFTPAGSEPNGAAPPPPAGKPKSFLSRIGSFFGGK
jgi:ferredoxin-NADP reductase/CRP-like cAMP-binding protein